MASMFGILGFLIPVMVVVLILFIVFAVRNDSTTGGDDMVKKIYVYMVLFVTLMMIIGGSVAVFMAVADIVSPTLYRQSFEEYVRWQTDEEFKGDEATENQLSREELREKYDAMILDEKENSRRWAINSLIKSFGWIVIPLPIFFFYQRKLKELGND